jgi:hypothetical protein
MTLLFPEKEAKSVSSASQKTNLGEADPGGLPKKQYSASIDWLVQVKLMDLFVKRCGCGLAVKRYSSLQSILGTVQR